MKIVKWITIFGLVGLVCYGLLEGANYIADKAQTITWPVKGLTLW